MRQHAWLRALYPHTAHGGIERLARIEQLWSSIAYTVGALPALPS